MHVEETGLSTHLTRLPDLEPAVLAEGQCQPGAGARVHASGSNGEVKITITVLV